MEIIVRKAKLKDIPNICKIDTFYKILNKCSPLDKLDVYIKGHDKYVKKFIYGKNRWVYVAEDDGEIIGFILFNIEKREPYWKVKEVGYIDLIFISEKGRGKGISKLLMNEAQVIFKKRRMKYVKLTVQTDNPQSHLIWKNQGFKDFRADMYKKL